MIIIKNIDVYSPDYIGKKDIFIAGDIGPVSTVSGVSNENLINEYFNIAKTFADEGIEIIQFETFMSLDVLADVIPKIKKELGLFIMVSFSVNQLGYSASGLSAKNLINDICAVDGVDAVGLNCGIGPYHMYNILEKIKLPEDKVLIAIPNAGYPVLTRNRMEFNSHPEYFAEKTKELLSLGADIIGGCCGTSPEFIKSLYDIMSMDIKADKKIQKTDAADEKVSKRCGFLYERKTKNLSPLNLYHLLTLMMRNFLNPHIILKMQVLMYLHFRILRQEEQESILSLWQQKFTGKLVSM